MSLTFDVEEFCYVEMSSACSCIEPASCFFAPTLSRAIVSAVTTRLANHQLVFAHTAKKHTVWVSSVKLPAAIIPVF